MCLDWNLRENPLDRLRALDSSEANVEALEFDAQPFVIDAQEVKHRCVKIRDGYRIFNRAIPQFIRRPKSNPALDSAARQLN